VTEDELAEHVRREVDAWPPLTEEQRARLWVLLEPMRESLARRR
jgi:hypothetical protein